MASRRISSRTLWNSWRKASFRHQRLKQQREIFALREPSSMFRAKTKNGIARICRRERLGFSEKRKLFESFWVMWPPSDGFKYNRALLSSTPERDSGYPPRVSQSA